MSNKLIVCSMFMVASLTGCLWILLSHDRKVAVSIILSSMACHGLIRGDMLLYSLIPFVVACCVTLWVFERYKDESYALLIALTSGIVVDAVLMIPWELAFFGSKVLPWIIVKSIFYKTLFAAMLSPMKNMEFFQQRFHENDN